MLQKLLIATVLALGVTATTVPATADHVEQVCPLNECQSENLNCVIFCEMEGVLTGTNLREPIERLQSGIDNRGLSSFTTKLAFSGTIIQDGTPRRVDNHPVTMKGTVAPTADPEAYDLTGRMVFGLGLPDINYTGTYETLDTAWTMRVVGEANDLRFNVAGQVGQTANGIGDVTRIRLLGPILR